MFGFIPSTVTFPTLPRDGMKITGNHGMKHRRYPVRLVDLYIICDVFPYIMNHKIYIYIFIIWDFIISSKIGSSKIDFQMSPRKSTHFSGHIPSVSMEHLGISQAYPLVNVYITNWKITMKFMAKSTNFLWQFSIANCNTRG